jgi:hypothetical protein
MDSFLYDVGYVTGTVVWYTAKTVAVGGAAVLSGAASAILPSSSESPVVAPVVKATAAIIPTVSVAADGAPIHPVFCITGAIIFVCTVVGLTACFFESKGTSRRDDDIVFTERRALPKTVVIKRHLDLNRIPTTLADNEHEQCCVCLTNKKTVGYNLCKHLLLCSECAKKMKDKKCPTCRQVSKKFVHVVL